MTQNDIIEMAIQAGASTMISKDSVEKALTSTAKIEAFANLVAAKEREACANVCESFGKYESDVAEAIRARGNP